MATLASSLLRSMSCRVRQLDDAIASRIHFKLKYDNLNRAADRCLATLTGRGSYAPRSTKLQPGGLQFVGRQRTQRSRGRSVLHVLEK